MKSGSISNDKHPVSSSSVFVALASSYGGGGGGVVFDRSTMVSRSHGATLSTNESSTNTQKGKDAHEERV